MAKAKVKELVHYVCARCDDPKKLGATKLNKVLWFTDSYAYRSLGKTITGETAYVKRQFGPVPKHIPDVIQELADEAKIAVREANYFGRRKREFVSLKTPNMKSFTDDERVIIDSVMDIVCDHHTAATISDLTHNIIWDAAEMGEEIPIFAVLASEEGTITRDDMKWATQAVKKRIEKLKAAA